MRRGFSGDTRPPPDASQGLLARSLSPRAKGGESPIADLCPPHHAAGGHAVTCDPGKCLKFTKQSPSSCPGHPLSYIRSEAVHTGG